MIASACTIVDMAPHRNLTRHRFGIRHGKTMPHPRHTRLVVSLTAAAFIFAASPGMGRTEDAVAAPDAPVLVRAKLVAETSTLQRGKSSWLAVQLAMRPGWHTYWRNPGDAGMATQIKWTLPEGATAGPIVWPVPQRFVARTIVGFGYPDEVALLTAVRIPATFPFDNIAIGATVSWLACEKVCLPGSETLVVALPVGDTAATTDPRNAKVFAQARRRIPQRAPFKATFSMDGEAVRIQIPRAMLGGLVRPELTFYPFDSSIIDHAAAQSTVMRERQAELTLRRSATVNEHMKTLDGLLIIKNVVSQAARALEVSAKAADLAATPPAGPLKARQLRQENSRR
jgi:thiol:disulfide interchange protein DsbD